MTLAWFDTLLTDARNQGRVDYDLSWMLQEGKNAEHDLLYRINTCALNHNPHDCEHVPVRRGIGPRVSRDDVLLPDLVGDEPSGEDILCEIDRVNHVHERHDLLECHQCGLRKPHYDDRVDTCGMEYIHSKSGFLTLEAGIATPTDTGREEERGYSDDIIAAFPDDEAPVYLRGSTAWRSAPTPNRLTAATGKRLTTNASAKRTREVTRMI